MPRPRIIFFTGMGCDERLLEPQRALDADIEVLPWLPFKPHEELNAYSDRMAELIDGSRPFYLGGVSLGGMVALACGARHPHNLRGLILISACRSNLGLPLPFRWVAQLVTLLPAKVLHIGKSVVPAMRSLFGISSSAEYALFRSMLAGTSPTFLKRSLRAVVRWPGPIATPTCPILQIHARQDHILWPRRSGANTFIDGGHTISISHARAVNEVISQWLIDREKSDVAAKSTNTPP